MDIPDTIPILVAVIGVTIISFGYLFQKIGLKEFTGFATFYKNRYGIIWMGGTGLTFLGSLLFFISLGYGDITVIQPITGLSPAIVTILGVIVFRTSVHRNEVIGIICSIAGIFFVSFRSMGQDLSPLLSESFLANFTYIASFGIIILVIVLNFIPTLDTGLVEGILGGITASLASIYAKVGLTIFITTNTLHWTLLAFMIMQTTAFISLQKALKHGRMDKIITIFTNVSILIPVGFGILFLAEMINPVNVFGMLLILGGVILLAKNYSEVFIVQAQDAEHTVVQ